MGGERKGNVRLGEGEGEGGLEFVLHLFSVVKRQFAGILDNDIVGRFVAVTFRNVFDVFNDIHSFQDSTEDCSSIRYTRCKFVSILCSLCSQMVWGKRVRMMGRYLPTCLPSNQLVFTVQIKNWAPFVFGPAFAIDSTPGPVCLSLKFSSSNFPP